MADRCFRLPEPPSLNTFWRSIVVKGQVRVLLSKEAREYKAMVAADGQRKGWQPLSGPIVLAVTWYRARRAGDLDNRLKCVLDSLQGVHYHNDSQIVEIHAKRAEDATDPRVVVVVRALEHQPIL